MISEDYHYLMTEVHEVPRLYLAKDLQNKTPRTLLYGYTVDRDTWHVYINYEGHIKTVKYAGLAGEVEQIHPRCNKQYVPNKRLYPAKCDYEFCKLLKEAGVHLPFTTFDKMHMPDTCHGRLLRGDFI